MINVTLKGGVVKEFENGTTVAEVAKSLGGGIYKNACACKINGELKDLRTVLASDTLSRVEILSFDDAEGKKTFWHTASHILAQAVKRLFPEAKLTIGPAIENGFYYDIDFVTPITQAASIKAPVFFSWRIFSVSSEISLPSDSRSITCPPIIPSAPTALPRTDISITALSAEILPLY